MPAPNMRFGEIGGGVIIRTLVYRFSVSDSPNCVQLTPQLRQAAASLRCRQVAKTSSRKCYREKRVQYDSAGQRPKRQFEK